MNKKQFSRVGKRSRRSGKRGEREVAARLRRLWPDVHSCRAGGEIVPGRDLLKTPGYCVQVKLRRSVDHEEAWREARSASISPEVPIAICRQPVAGRPTPWLVTLQLEDFIELVNDAQTEIVIHGDGPPLARPRRTRVAG